jgi:hypothetical protein
MFQFKADSNKAVKQDSLDEESVYSKSCIYELNRLVCLFQIRVVIMYIRVVMIINIIINVYKKNQTVSNRTTVSKLFTCRVLDIRHCRNLHLGLSK